MWPKDTGPIHVAHRPHHHPMWPKEPSPTDHGHKNPALPSVAYARYPAPTWPRDSAHCGPAPQFTTHCCQETLALPTVAQKLPNHCGYSPPPTVAQRPRPHLLWPRDPAPTYCGPETLPPPTVAQRPRPRPLRPSDQATTTRPELHVPFSAWWASSCPTHRGPENPPSPIHCGTKNPAPTHCAPPPPTHTQR